MGEDFDSIRIRLEADLTSLKRLGDDVDRAFGPATSSVQKSAKGWDAAITGAVAGMAAAISQKLLQAIYQIPAALVTSTAEFEAQATKIETLVGLSREEVEGLTQSLLDMAPAVGVGPVELAEALFVVTSAGQSGADALKIVEEAAKASAIGLGDTADIARAVTSVLNAYGTENISAARATEILTATVREGNLEASELAPALGKIIPVASQLGVGFDEVGANIATFTRLGINSREAVTGLQGVLTAMLAPTEQAAKAMAEMGLSGESLRKSLSEQGLQATLAMLIERFRGNEEALFKVIGRVEGFVNVLGTAGSQGAAYAEVLRSVQEESQGIVDQGFERTTETLAFQWNALKANAESAAIAFGTLVLPAIKFLVKELDRLTTDLDNFRKGLLEQSQVVRTNARPALEELRRAFVDIALALQGSQSATEEISTLDVVLVKLTNVAAGASASVRSIALALKGDFAGSMFEAHRANEFFTKALLVTRADLEQTQASVERAAGVRGGEGFRAFRQEIIDGNPAVIQLGLNLSDLGASAQSSKEPVKAMAQSTKAAKDAAQAWAPILDELVAATIRYAAAAEPLPEDLLQFADATAGAALRVAEFHASFDDLVEGINGELVPALGVLEDDLDSTLSGMKPLEIDTSAAQQALLEMHERIAGRGPGSLTHAFAVDLLDAVGLSGRGILDTFGLGGLADTAIGQFIETVLSELITAFAVDLVGSILGESGFAGALTKMFGGTGTDGGMFGQLLGDSGPALGAIAAFMVAAEVIWTESWEDMINHVEQGIKGLFDLESWVGGGGPGHESPQPGDPNDPTSIVNQAVNNLIADFLELGIPNPSAGGLMNYLENLLDPNIWQAFVDSFGSLQDLLDWLASRLPSLGSFSMIMAPALPGALPGGLSSSLGGFAPASPSAPASMTFHTPLVRVDGVNLGDAVIHIIGAARAR